MDAPWLAPVWELAVVRGAGKGNAEETALMARQISLLQQFVHTCVGTASEQVSELMAPSLAEPQRLFGAVLALILAGSGGDSSKLELGRQDAKRAVRFQRLPPVLQLHLKRFEYDAHTGSMSKLQQVGCGREGIWRWAAGRARTTRVRARMSLSLPLPRSSS